MISDEKRIEFSGKIHKLLQDFNLRGSVTCQVTDDTHEQGLDPSIVSDPDNNDSRVISRPTN